MIEMRAIGKRMTKEICLAISRTINQAVIFDRDKREEQLADVLTLNRNRQLSLLIAW